MLPAESGLKIHSKIRSKIFLLDDTLQSIKKNVDVLEPEITLITQLLAGTVEKDLEDKTRWKNKDFVKSELQSFC